MPVSQCSKAKPQSALGCRLSVFNVSHDGLTGPLSIFLDTDFQADSFDDNPELCGNPLSPYKGRGDVDPFVEVFFKGFGIGWTISFNLITVFCSFSGIPKMSKVISICRRNKRTQKDAIGGAKAIEPKMILKLEKYVTRIIFQEPANLTSNFCDESVNGFGKKGKMYRAITPNDCSPAIKKFYASRNSDNKFVSLGIVSWHTTASQFVNPDGLLH